MILIFTYLQWAEPWAKKTKPNFRTEDQTNFPPEAKKQTGGSYIPSAKAKLNFNIPFMGVQVLS